MIWTASSASPPSPDSQRAIFKLLRDREYLPELVRSIEKAGRSIEASLFLIDPGIARPTPLEAVFGGLREAFKRGVKVRIETSSIFAKKPSGERLKRLARKFEVPFTWGSPKEFLHQKSVTIDGRVHLVGSHNWTPASLLENREVSVKVEGPAEFLDAQGFRRELLRAIRNAQGEITLATYDITEVVESDQDFADEVVRQLTFARMKNRKVRLLLDASRVRGDVLPARDLILYRGRAKAEALARWGVHVYYDTTEALFHAKIAVIDGEEVFIGSQNINPAREGEREKSVRFRSRELADEIKTYLARVFRTSERFRYHPLEIPGVKIPLRWVRRGGPVAKIFQTRGVLTLRLLLALLAEAQRLRSHEIPWDEERLAKLAGIQVPRRFTRFVKNRADFLRRILTQPRIFLARHHGLLRYDLQKKRVFLLDEAGKPYRLPEENYFVVPWEYWNYGWSGRLTSGERYAYLTQLAEVSQSPEAPFWSSLAVREVSRLYGISWQRFSKQNVRLERLNLIEVDRDVKIGKPDVPKRPSRYRINPLWSKAEEEAALGRLAEEFMASEADLGEARRLADKLNQPHDVEVIRKFLILIERYGREKVRRATALTARFKPHFALRNVHHTAGILRNWSQGIYKGGRRR